MSDVNRIVFGLAQIGILLFGVFVGVVGLILAWIAWSAPDLLYDGREASAAEWLGVVALLAGGGATAVVLCGGMLIRLFARAAAGLTDDGDAEQDGEA